MSPRERIAHAIKSAAASGEPALVAYLTAGYPQREKFREQVRALAAGADVLEIGVPFTDPMADGLTIQALDARQIALVQMVTPVTEPQRLAQLCAGSQGFVYAVTMTGTTGRNVAVPDEVLAYLDRVRASSPIPVCAGFGIRSREQVKRLRGHVDGVVVGSALVEVLERGEDPTPWLGRLRS
ncbi:MAG: hypothetical protein E6K50_10255 [Gammaproteobacteria bacterium]|nr:MAG: hypothetical protein E6K50_10255 [Gammaproteobacteria bacterium]